MPSDGVHIKASRLLDEGRVEPRPFCSTFEVQGDSDTYTVVIGAEFWFCSCPSTVKCSHALAAERWFKAENDAVIGREAAALELSEYVRCLVERKHSEEVAG